MFFGGLDFDPFSILQQQEEDILGNIAGGVVKGILQFFSEKKGKQSYQLSPLGMQVLQQAIAETQMGGAQLPEIIVQKAINFGLSLEEAQLVAFNYAFWILRFSVIGSVVQQAFAQEILSRFPAEQNVPQIGMQKGLQPQEIQMATQMIIMNKSRRPLIKQAIQQVLNIFQNQPFDQTHVYQYVMQMGLMPVEALFVAMITGFLI